MSKKKTAGNLDIAGLIIANKWDQKGNVIGVAIHTDKEEIYLVEHNRLESELFNRIQSKVMVKGKIRERLDGNKLIYVKSIQDLDNEISEKKAKQSRK